jgi:hypothetical protein
VRSIARIQGRFVSTCGLKKITAAPGSRYQLVIVDQAGATAWIYWRDLLTMDVARSNPSALLREVGFDEVSNRQWG